ncbi:MAG: hypothetical protein ACLPVY_15260 [Acidimicrobiia bacterium]
MYFEALVARLGLARKSLKAAASRPSQSLTTNHPSPRRAPHDDDAPTQDLPTAKTPDPTNLQTQPNALTPTIIITTPETHDRCTN